MYDDPLSIISFSPFLLILNKKWKVAYKEWLYLHAAKYDTVAFFVLCTHAPINLLDGISAFSLSSAATEFVVLLLVCMTNGDKVCSDFDRIE